MEVASYVGIENVTIFDITAVSLVMGDVECCVDLVEDTIKARIESC
jgi:hypothetical protein